MTDRILIDGTDLSWQSFAEELTTLRRPSERQGATGQVRPPRGCGTEARRLVRHLDLADRIEVLGTTRAPARLTHIGNAPAGNARRTSLAGALLALIGLQPPGRSRPTCE